MHNSKVIGEKKSERAILPLDYELLNLVKPHDKSMLARYKSYSMFFFIHLSCYSSRDNDRFYEEEPY